MFKLRVLSAAVLLPLVIFGILYLPTIYISIASGIVFTMAAWEWVNMTVFKDLFTKYALIASYILVAILLLITGIFDNLVFMISILFWLLGFIGICYFPKGSDLWRQKSLQPLVGLIMFVPAWLAFNKLHAYGAIGPVWVLLACCLIWGADIGAYISGKLWGKTKLIPNVSPGKTVAGFIGALVLGCGVMTVFYLLFKPGFSYISAVWLALITILFSVVGDLVESLQKRLYGVKDSGTLIPGHGGIYDRIDSMLAAFPIYMLGLQIIFNLRIMAI